MVFAGIGGRLPTKLKSGINIGDAVLFDVMRQLERLIAPSVSVTGYFISERGTW